VARRVQLSAIQRTDKTSDWTDPVWSRDYSYRCLHNIVPWHLTEMCMPIGLSAHRQGLRSATTSDSVIPRVWLVMYCSRAFSVTGPICWNGLPDYLKSLDLSFRCFKRQLKTFLFCVYYAVLCYFSVLETFVDILCKCNLFDLIWRVLETDVIWLRAGGSCGVGMSSRLMWAQRNASLHHQNAIITRQHN